MHQFLLLFFIIVPLGELKPWIRRRLWNYRQGYLLTKEGTLQGERIWNVEFSEDNNTRCGLLLLLNSESALIEGKGGIFVAAEQRDDPEICIFDSTLMLVVLICAAVEEHVLLSGVAMHIAVKDALPLNVSISHHEL